MADDAGLDDEARKSAGPEVPVRAWVEQLARAGLQKETVAALAQLLPKRNAVGWALETIRRTAAPAAGTAPAAALQAVEEWLENPDEDRRHRAGETAADAGYGSAAGCLALAVFLSGGNLAPKDTPAMAEPPPYLCGRTVAGSIALAIASQPKDAPEHQRRALQDGFRLAEQTGVWKAIERRA